MEPWFIPAVSAGGAAVAVIIVYVVVFYRRATALVPANIRVPQAWSSSVGETTNHVMRDQMLDRFILFSLNLTSILWSMEHSIVHTDRALVYFRRCLNIVAVFTGLFAIGIADELYLNWGCYESDRNLNELDQGLCSDSSSPIRGNATGLVGDILIYRKPDTWIWISNAVFAGCVVLSLAIHAYLSYNFADRVRHGLEGNYTGTIDAINQHQSCDADKVARLKKYTWTAFHTHINNNTSTVFSPHEINLHRVTELFLDPFAIVFGFPLIVLARSDLAIANFINLLAMHATWVLYFEWAMPRYEASCCYYDEATQNGNGGACDDPTAPIANDPFRLSCSGLNIELTVILSIGLFQILLMLVFWLYGVILYNFIVYKTMAKTLQVLDQAAKDTSESIDVHHSKYPPPVYGLDDSPPPYKPKAD